MQPQLVPQFRTEITLNGQATGTGHSAKLSITAPDQRTTEQMIKRVLPGATLSEESDNTVAIYHPEVNGGKKPCGTTCKWMANQGFDVESTVQSQLKAA